MWFTLNKNFSCTFPHAPSYKDQKFLDSACLTSVQDPLMRKKFPLTLNIRMIAATGNKHLDREFESQGRLGALNIQKMLA